jgi:low temperature requirement protein LtrA
MPTSTGRPVCPGNGRFARDVYSFAHFTVIAGVIGLAVAIEESVLHPADPLPWAGAVAPVIGVILFVGGTGAALGSAGFGLPIPRIATIVERAAATPLFAAIPAWSTFAIAAMMFAGLALTERSTIARVM